MTLPSTFPIVVQAIAALLIFVASYLALFLSLIALLGTAVFVYRAIRLLWCKVVKSAWFVHRGATTITSLR